jgi:CubicO group peptidase (beta-lactamase class C family)
MRLAVLLALTLLSPWEAVRAHAKPLESFDAYVTRSMADWKVPGLAVAIVRNGSVVLAKGYGVKTVGQPGRVDAATVFAIGSATKAFTATAVAMLVDEGKVRWDDPVTRHLLGFQLYDPYVTRELTVRDLLTHRSGLGSGDLIVYSEKSRDRILSRVRYLKPATSFRSQFGYQNIMYLAAGQLTARVTDRSWDEVIRERIFTPLGMTTSTTTTNGLDRLPNVATPHLEADDTVRTIPWFNLDNVAPAGSINSNVLEMAHWLRFQLAGGKVGGKPLLSAAAFEETHEPQTIVPLEGAWRLIAPEAHFLSYGIGWFLHDYEGRKIVMHGGNIDGMSALMALMPEENTGLVVLTNLDGNDLTYALMYRVFDAYLKQPPKDWSTSLLKAVRTLVEQGEKEKKAEEAQRVEGTTPSLALARYAGTYADTMYGEATVRNEGSELVLQYGTLVADLAHWQYDTFRATWRSRRVGKSYVTFTLDATGKVDEMRMPGFATFTREPEVADTAPGVQLAEAELPRHTGSFVSASLPVTAEVQLVGGQLKLTIPGQPAYTLVSVTATRFRLTGDGVPAGFFLDYTMESGRVRRVTLVQPEPQPSLTLVPKSDSGR